MFWVFTTSIGFLLCTEIIQSDESFLLQQLINFGIYIYFENNLSKLSMCHAQMINILEQKYKCGHSTKCTDTRLWSLWSASSPKALETQPIKQTCSFNISSAFCLQNERSTFLSHTLKSYSQHNLDLSEIRTVVTAVHGINSTEAFPQNVFNRYTYNIHLSA